MSRISPLFVALLAAASVAVAAALAAEPLAPDFALRSALVYREEVGLAVFAGGYVVAMLLWLAARGRVVRRVDLPGGAGFEATGEAEVAAAEHAASLSALAQQLDRLSARVDDLEGTLGGRNGG